MKKHQKRNYWHFLLKHVGVMALLWVLLFYLFLQAAYGVIFSEIEQRSAVNFYEGMETIQYVMKDTALLDAQVELRQTLGVMSDAGQYYISHSSNPVIKDYGNLLGIQFGWMQAFLFWDGIGNDGRNNTYLNGFGKGIGFILDAETDEVVFDSRWIEDVEYLYLTSNDHGGGDSKSVTFTVSYRDTLYCTDAELEPVLQELNEIKDKWNDYYRETDPNWTEKRLRWRMDEFYVKEDHFFPSKVSLYYVDVRDYFTARGEDRYPDVLVETKELERKAQDGERLYVVDAEKERVDTGCLNGLSSLRYYDGTYESWVPDDAFCSAAIEAILRHQEVRSEGYMTSDIGNSWSVGNPLIYFLNGEMVFVRTAYFQDGKGHLYKACTYQSISELFKQNLGGVAGCGILLALVLMALSVFTAYVSYVKNKQRFMTEEYRTMLMDSMAHDLKSPLMAISGYADNLREHLNDEKRDHYAEQIQKSVGYMNDIVMKNLEIIKFGQESKKLIRKKVNVRHLFEEAFDRHQGEVDSRKLKVVMDGEMMARGDEGLLQKIAENLVTNCIRYAREGGEISITFASRRLVMKNETDLEYDGNLKRLWEPFVRGEDSRGGKGTGLGLAIVAHVLDRHSWKYRLGYDKENKVFFCEIKIPFGILF